MAQANGMVWQARSSSGDYPFDAWLHHMLEERYRRVLSEPLPSEWLAILAQEDMPEDDG
jgi:hypothetical protein